MGGGGGGGGGFSMPKMPSVSTKSLGLDNPGSWVSGLGGGSYLGTLGGPIGSWWDNMVGNNKNMWGKEGGMEAYATQSADQLGMTKAYADNMKKYAEYARPGLASLMAQGRMEINPSTTVNPWATNQFFQQNVYDPAMEHFQGVTLPGIREAMGKNYWSTARRAQEQNAALQNDKNLMQQLANLQYQDEQARRQIADVTQARRIQENAREQAQRMNILQLLDPLYAQHFAPVATAHTVDHAQSPYQPGFMDRLGQVMGIASSGVQTAGNIGKLAAMV